MSAKYVLNLRSIDELLAFRECDPSSSVRRPPASRAIRGNQLFHVDYSTVVGYRPQNKADLEREQVGRH